MTTGERLALLAGASGTAAALLLLIGSGATTGEALVDFSQLPTATAAEHLLAEGDGVQAPTEGHGFVITDTAPQLWWKRKPRAMPVEEAAQKVKTIAGTIERIASKQAVTGKEARREVLQAIAPQLEFMPGFDWLALYRTILLELHIRREQQAEQERQQEAEILTMRILREEEDVVVLLMAEWGGYV